MKTSVLPTKVAKLLNLYVHLCEITLNTKQLNDISIII